MKSRVFISRNLKADSPLLSLKEHCTLISESLLVFEALPVAAIPPSDWIFFYSKRAIDFFLKLQAAPSCQLAVMGEASAAHLERYGLKADFCGQGSPNKIAAAFGLVAQNKQVLFPRAMHSRKSIQRLCAAQIKVLDLVVYNNKKRATFNHPLADILVFTSPLNAEAYLESFPIQPQQKIISIGPTTSQYLNSKNIVCETATEAKESALLAIILKQL